MDKPSLGAGILTLDITSNEQTMNISFEIPIQTLIIKNVRVHMTNAANALSERVIYFNIPVIMSSKIIDGNLAHNYIPIFLDNAIVTNHTSLDIPIYMGQVLPAVFDVQILNSSFIPLANLERFSIQMTTEYGSF